MLKKINKHFQTIKGRWLCAALLLVSLAGCADSADQTDDLSTPTAGMLHFADQLREQGDMEGATDFYIRAVQGAPNSPNARRKLAEILVARGDTKDAADQYAVLVKLEGATANDHCAYGRLLV